MYTSVEAVIAELPPRYDATRITPETIAAKIEEWSRYCDGYVATRYQLPLPSVPPVLGVACKMLVVHALHVEHGLFRGEPNRQQTLWAQAHDILRGIADGKISLVGVGSTDAATTHLPLSTTRDGYRGLMSLAAQERRFGRLPK